MMCKRAREEIFTFIFFPFSLVNSKTLRNFALAFERVQTYLLNSLVNHHLKSENEQSLILNGV